MALVMRLMWGAARSCELPSLIRRLPAGRGGLLPPPIRAPGGELEAIMGSKGAEDLSGCQAKLSKLSGGAGSTGRSVR